MNSKQRRKANRAFKTMKDAIVIRLRFQPDITSEQIALFMLKDNFLLKRRPPRYVSSYWRCLSSAGRRMGIAQYAKAKICSRKKQ